ncbi:hypothetical protein [Streptomyces sp. NRRL S-31]|uniref:hypothetical protein n=1 Tax=Streptomyces sp. NRRL S-31 TaxID=1463898 RepID=UPI0004C5B379|nr:hypothetical protein [Streptomyces sp. NRRL S-31]
MTGERMTGERRHRPEQPLSERPPNGGPLSDQDRQRIDSIGLSRISHHGDLCCAEARYLVLRRFERWADTGDRLAAVPLLVRWAPTRWPLTWCRLAEPDEWAGDCGVHADLAGELLTLAGVAYARGRAAIEPYPRAVPHWRATWSASDADDTWIGDDVVHHEVLRIGARWWDPTEARWFTGAGAHLLAGRVAAVRTEGADWSPAGAD